MASKETWVVNTFAMLTACPAKEEKRRGGGEEMGERKEGKKGKKERVPC